MIDYAAEVRRTRIAQGLAETLPDVVRSAVAALIPPAAIARGGDRHEVDA